MTQKTLSRIKLASLLSATLISGVSIQSAQAVDMARQPVLVITNKPTIHTAAPAPIVTSPHVTKPNATNTITTKPTMAHKLAPVQQPAVRKPYAPDNKPSYTPTYTNNKNTPIFSRPARAPEITQADIYPMGSHHTGRTAVGNRIDALGKDLGALQTKMRALSEKLQNVGERDRKLAAKYHANVASLNTQLQTGTTPGNPRLVKKLKDARSSLETLSKNTGSLNALSVEIAEVAARAHYLLKTARSTYNLSGAVEEDHIELARMENEINTTTVSADRLLNDINNDVILTTSYLGTEDANLRTLSLGVENGNLSGKRLTHAAFSNSSSRQQSSMIQPASYGSNNAPTHAKMPPTKTVNAGGSRPLAKIRFNKAEINYKQPITMAVEKAQQRFPNARFELMAIHPSSTNAAQESIAKTRARRNAEEVLKTLTDMGVPLDKIDVSAAPSAQAKSNEVHLFVR